VNGRTAEERPLLSEQESVNSAIKWVSGEVPYFLHYAVCALNHSI
jgi:hypothetical protein